MILGFIYVIENRVNDKLYIGQTTDLPKRIRKHFHNNRKGTAIGSAIRKYGAENFELVLLESCSSQEELDSRESYWIEALDTRAPSGYNLTSGGFAGGKHSPETIAKIRISKLGSNNAMFGKELSPEHKEKVSQGLKAWYAKNESANLGKKHSEETKRKMRENQTKGDAHWLRKNSEAAPPFLGRKHSEETKEKMRLAHLGKKASPAAIEKNRLSHIGRKQSSCTIEKKRLALTGSNNPLYGKPLSEEHKDKLRKANVGKKQSDETKRKISEALKQRFLRKRNDL